MRQPLKPRAILIDLDGTLADSLPVMKKVYQAFMRLVQREPTDSEFASLNGPPLPEIIRRLKQTHAIEEDEKILHQNYIDLILNEYEQVLPRQGADDFLRQAKQQKCVIGLVTSSSKKIANIWLNAAALNSYIDFIVASEDVTQGKPHPEPYLLGMKHAALPPSAIIAVEDSFQGATAAVQSGLTTFVIPHENRSWPVNVSPVQSFTELARELW